MRALLVLLSAVFVLSACSKEVKMVPTNSYQDPVRIEEKVNVDLLLSKSDMAKYTDIEDGVWNEARKAGLIKLFNKILSRNLSMVPIASNSPLSKSLGMYTEEGVVNLEADAETGDLEQSFLVSASFGNDLGAGGQIVSIEEDRFVSGMNDIVYALLYNIVPESLPSYVMIAEPISEVGSSFYRIIGMAEIIQVSRDAFALSQLDGGTTGVMCSLEVLVSDREIEATDRIFLMSVSLAAIDRQPSQGGDVELETVVVQPPHSDKVQAPKEKK